MAQSVSQAQADALRSRPGVGTGAGGAEASADGRAPTGFRSDVEGLRALSVLLVVACHAGVPFLAGGFIGVDVFFVISGFLITGLLLREATATGGISIREFYARRARRILPMAALTLVSVCVAAWFVMPAIDRSAVGTDVIGAALFVSNWVFAAQANDYFAMDVTSSPVLHFWSLSVEEQFYLIWPVLILVLAVLARRRSWTTTGKRVLFGVGLGVPVAASAWWTMSGGGAGPLGYFGLQTRLWELGAGGLAAVLLVRPLRLPTLGRRLAGYSGIALIMFAALTFTSETPFPGVYTLYPVLGALLVVCSGAPGERGAGLLSIRPMQYVGARSYNLYLWHWPFLVFAGLIVSGGVLTEDVDGVAGTAWAAAVAVVLAFLVTVVTFRFVETPARHLRQLRARPWMTLMFAAVIIASTVGAAQWLITSGEAQAVGSGAEGTESSATTTGVELPAAPVTTTLTGYAAPTWPLRDASMSGRTARDDHFTPPTRCQPPRDEDLSADCIYGDRRGKTRIALVGDSHASMWLPAFDAFGKAHGIQVSFWAHSGWTPTPIIRPDNDEPRAKAWRAKLISMLQQTGPYEAIVVGRTSGHWGVGAVGPDGEKLQGDQAAPAFEAAARQFAASVKGDTSRIVFLRDTNWGYVNLPSCIDAQDGRSARCAFPRQRKDDALAAAEIRGAQVEFPGRVFEVDPAPLACPLAMEKCPAVAPDGAIMFSDGNHLTITVARNLAPGVYTLLAPTLSGQ